MNFSNSKTPTPIHMISDDQLEATLSKLSAREKNWLETNGFKAGIGQTTLIPSDDGNLQAVYFGLGNAATRARDRLHTGKLPFALPEGDYQLTGGSARDALAWALGSYQFRNYLSDGRAPATLTYDANDAGELEVIATACARTQDLINEPANIMTTDRLADEVQKLASEHDAKFSEIKGDELLTENFPMIHAVGRASVYAPRLLELNWGNPKHPKITIVGKGVCFDTGGLDIKPPSSMKLMKKDMGGAANAIGLAHMIMSLDLPICLTLLIPAVENSISANAFRPGDILTARDGQTVEINNTDAEGRLVLADALTYAAEQNPDQIISLATLTGAARVALGPDIMPFYCDEDDFAHSLETSAKNVEDPLWRMPFWKPYDEMIEPQQAQLDNAPAGGFAGSITAALFLKRFTQDQPYAHFDIYGWTPSAKPARAFGGAAQAIRAIFNTLSEQYK